MRKRLVIAALVAAFAAGAVSFLSPAEAKVIPCTTIGVCEYSGDWITQCCIYSVPVDPDCRGRSCEYVLVEECEDIRCP